MKTRKRHHFWTMCFLVLAFLSFFPEEGKGAPELDSLLPELENWKQIEEPSRYLPENLFEYINGAAEIYLAYSFKELVVAQYGQAGSEVNLSVEIYQMADENNAFGIYSAERFPDNNFIPVGVQGYLEEGSLNYLIGPYYIKLLCFEGGDRSAEYLNLFAKTIADNSRAAVEFPRLIQNLPKEAIVANSEKYIQKNVMGYSFLHDGYFANYRIGDFEFDCFIIAGEDEGDAQMMWDKYLEAKNELPIERTDLGFRIKDKYYHYIYLSKTGRFICGVMKIQEGQQEKGREFLKSLIESLKSDFSGEYK